MVIAIIMVVAANTMAMVAGRTGEIGTLRALGFTRPEILIAFIAEALLLGLVGGIGGVGGAALLQLLTINTLNWQTFFTPTMPRSH